MSHALDGYAKPGMIIVNNFRHEINRLACCERKASGHIAFICVMSYSALWPSFLARGQTCSTTECAFPRTSKYLDRLRRLLSTEFT